jgi:hypothetical protein
MGKRAGHASIHTISSFLKYFGKKLVPKVISN